MDFCAPGTLTRMVELDNRVFRFFGQNTFQKSYCWFCQTDNGNQILLDNVSALTFSLMQATYTGSCCDEKNTMVKVDNFCKYDLSWNPKVMMKTMQSLLISKRNDEQISLFEWPVTTSKQRAKRLFSKVVGAISAVFTGRGITELLPAYSKALRILRKLLSQRLRLFWKRSPVFDDMI